MQRSESKENADLPYDATPDDKSPAVADDLHSQN